MSEAKWFLDSAAALYRATRDAVSPAGCPSACASLCSSSDLDTAGALAAFSGVFDFFFLVELGGTASVNC